MSHSGAHRDTEAVASSSAPESFDERTMTEADSAARGTPTTLPPRTVIGRYVVLEPIGAGGMGIVYAAFDFALGRKVAIKLVRARPGKPSFGSARLLREAQAAAKLSHPNIITIHDVGTFAGQVFIAMEIVEGGSLAAWLDEQRRPWRDVLAAFVQAGRGLAAAHAAGIIHRDFKPENVFIGRDGRVRVGDFGLARAASSPSEGDDAIPAEVSPSLEEPLSAAAMAESALTRTGTRVGTPAYMAPEQHAGEVVDHRADQFSFCVALYEGLYGQRPFRGEDMEAIAAHAGIGLPRDPPEDSRTPAWLYGVLARGLSARPKDRFPSMDALLAALNVRHTTWTRAVALAMAVLAGTTLALWHGQQPPPLLCAGAERKLAGVWDDGRRERAHEAFLATGAPGAPETWRTVERNLDEYAAGWVKMHTEACEATQLRGEQSQEMLDLRTQCLSRRLDEVNALVDLFTRADSTVVSKAAVASRLVSSVNDCADAVLLREGVRLPSDPAKRAVHDALARQLAEVKALQYTAKYTEALALADTVTRTARQEELRATEAPTTTAPAPASAAWSTTSPRWVVWRKPSRSAPNSSTSATSWGSGTRSIGSTTRAPAPPAATPTTSTR